MKKAYGLVDLLIVLVIIILCFVIFSKNGNPVKDYANEQVKMHNQKGVAEEQIEQIQNVRNLQLQREQEMLKEDE